MRNEQMKNIEKAYDGRNINEMAPYARLMGEVNERHLSKLERFEMWWDCHLKTRYTLGFLAGAVMVGFAIYHMYTFS